MDTTSFIPVEFPYTLGHNEVAYTLTPSDFGVTTVSGDIVNYLTVDYGVFNVDARYWIMSKYPVVIIVNSLFIQFFLYSFWESVLVKVNVSV